MRANHGIAGTGYFGSHPAEANYLASTFGQVTAQPMPPHPHNVRPIGTQRTFPKRNSNFHKNINTSVNASPEAKTPLMLVNEGVAKIKKVLDWQLIESGENAQKTYAYTVRIRELDLNHRPDDLIAEGKPSSCKKTAKQLCALELLRAVSNSSVQRVQSAKFGLPLDQNAAMQFIARKSKSMYIGEDKTMPEGDRMENPLAQVHLLCMGLHISAPDYKFIDPLQTGQHFVCTASLGKFVQRGTGLNKKEAKREAVKLYIPLLTHIKGDKPENINERIEKELGISQDKSHEEKKARPPRAPQIKLAKFTPGVTIKSLPDVLKKKNADLASTLQNISLEHPGIKSIIIELAPRDDGVHQCHLALQCPSYVYFYGQGDSKEAASQNAMFSALQFINTNVVHEEQSTDISLL